MWRVSGVIRSALSASRLKRRRRAILLPRRRRPRSTRGNNSAIIGRPFHDRFGKVATDERTGRAPRWRPPPITRSRAGRVFAPKPFARDVRGNAEEREMDGRAEGGRDESRQTGRQAQRVRGRAQTSGERERPARFSGGRERRWRRRTIPITRRLASTVCAN